MKFILVLILLLPSKGISDHYKTGFLFSDPNYRGCIWVYDIVDGKNSCVERSPKFYFHEGKHKGSMAKAKNQCVRYLRSMYGKVKRKYKGELFELDYYCQHD